VTEVIFGNATGGTPLMEANQSIGIGRELQALRRLQRESPTSLYVFVSERGAPLSVVELSAHSGADWRGATAAATRLTLEKGSWRVCHGAWQCA
jgi:hypothetical protein